MKAVGVIAEYNPFHTGHARHLELARRISGADYTVAVMSPDFVQRGEPAVFDKYTRARMALQNGADLVLELPVCYACGSAEYFARGAVALLEGLGSVHTLCFGCETPDAGLLKSAAALLSEEPESFRDILKDGLRRGLTYPEARMEALQNCLPLPSSAETKTFFSSPNNILGIEYCKALLRFSAPIEILPVQREGNAYHSLSLEGNFCSASAIRRALSEGKNLPLSHIPENCREDFTQACRSPVFSQDLLPWLTEKLLTVSDFSPFLDVSPDLSRRISRLRFTCVGKSWEEITGILKTRQITEARIRRVLLHLVLGLTREAANRFLSDGTVFYARILGFRREAAPLLHRLKQTSAFPLISKPSAAIPLLDKTGREMLELDFLASHLYGAARSLKYGLPFRTEYEQSPVIL